MSHISKFIRRMCKQTAVYWPSPVKDGQGGFTYGTPVELRCRWEDKRQLLSEDQGEKLISRAVVVLLQEVDENGLLYLGRLSSLDSDQIESPEEISNICIIKRPEKTPAVGSDTIFLYKAFLTPWLT